MNREFSTGSENFTSGNSQITDFKCGRDFIMTLRSNQNIYTMGGANKNGQLGTGKQTMNKLSTEFECVDALLEFNVKSIFAGAS